MTQEALKLALDALDLAQALLEKSNHHSKILDAYTAIKEALEESENDALIIQYHEMTIKRLEKRIEELTAQPELCKYGQEPKSCTSSPMDCQCAIEAALAQPEQEHVAWEQFHEHMAGSFYKPPPQRPWVGLTDDEKSELWEISRAALPRYATYASLVEAKLKEKNA